MLFSSKNSFKYGSTGSILNLVPNITPACPLKRSGFTYMQMTAGHLELVLLRRDSEVLLQLKEVEDVKTFLRVLLLLGPKSSIITI